MYIKDSIQAYEMQIEKEPECEESIWCNIATQKSALTIRVGSKRRFQRLVSSI